MLNLFDSVESLTKLYKLTQYAAIGLTLMAALSGAVSFWAGNKRDALRDAIALQREQFREEQELIEKGKLKHQNEELQRNLQRERRKREEFQHRIIGGTVLR